MPEIGETLREARMRAKIDVSEVEATTKIRAKYLRALENEEWGLAPGPPVGPLVPPHVPRLSRPRPKAPRGGVPPAPRASARARPRADRPEPRARAPRGADPPAAPVARLGHRPVGAGDPGPAD